MTYALSWSGGKDSTLALDRAVRDGLRVGYLFNIFDGASGRIRFHGVRSELIAAQAEALGLELIQRAAGEDDFEDVFLAIVAELTELGVRGALFGNIHLADVRAWYEERTTDVGLEHLEPLWGDPPEELIREFATRGYRGVVVSVDLSRSEEEWLGREIDEGFISEVVAAPGVDACGEHGEFHSFVYDGPLFRRVLPIRRGALFEAESHRLLDLTLDG
jgi:uncharacterized protein (TIGR00290 family)